MRTLVPEQMLLRYRTLRALRHPWRALLRYRTVRVLRYPRLHYYKSVVAPRILHSSPIECGADAGELRILTCERDVVVALWALKSFLRSFGARPAVTIHSDGTLTDGAIDVLRRHLPGVVIQGRDEADAAIRRALVDHPWCQRFRDESPLAMKLFDTNMLSSSGFVLIDSDVLFFEPLTALREAVSRGRGAFMSDYQDAYVPRRQVLEEHVGFPVVSRLNSGLMHVPQGLLDLDFLEPYFEYLFTTSGVAPGMRTVWGEQSAYALLVSRSRDKFDRLPDNYAVSRRSTDPSAASGHFVNDGSRDLMYTVGLKRLAKTLFP